MKVNLGCTSNYQSLTVFIGLIVIALSSCKSYRQPLYAWGTYATDTYAVINNQGDKSKLKQTYEAMIEKAQQSERKQVPPGIYAEYGILLITLGENEKGVSMLEKEVETYPESEVYIRKMLKTTKL